MSNIQELFASPELYPLKIDFAARCINFVRMTRQAYQSCLFASFRGARRFGGELSQIRLDDVLLASRSAYFPKRTVYIFHTAYCCSTLLARYFELFPCSFVLQEPPLLAQIANTTHTSVNQWNEALDVCVRLLARTFESDHLPVIKTHVPCNMIGRQLLDHNALSSVIYLFTPLRSFVLAVLKSEKRRHRVRIWSKEVSREVARCPELAHISPDQLDDAQTAIYWWLATRFLCEELRAGTSGSRVAVVNGERLAECPEEVLPVLLDCYGLPWEEEQFGRILNDPLVHTHSKHPERRFEISDLRAEMASLEDHYGSEADLGLSWMAAQGFNDELPAPGLVVPRAHQPLDQGSARVNLRML